VSTPGRSQAAPLEWTPIAMLFELVTAVFDVVISGPNLCSVPHV
jgi:hypothetical protein